MKFFLKFKKGKIAFSLVEMMVSVVAISILLAAFVPVVTKKAKPKINVAASSSKFTQNCSEKFSSDCIFCDGKKRCIICNKTCTSGNYKDPDTCSCKPCSAIDAHCTSCSNGGVCNSCADGYLLEDNVCKPCPSGYYCVGGTKTKCPKGTYGENAAVRSECTPCSAGTASNVLGATSSSACATCPAGTYSLASASVCTNCIPGKWSSAGRKTACTDDCEAGYACRDGSKTYCVAGTYSNAGASSCSACTSGYYCTGGSNRTSCESKTPYCSTCDSITGTCDTCQVGRYLSGNSCNPCSSDCLGCSDSTTCTSCPYGYHLSYGSCYPDCYYPCYSCSSPNYCDSCYSDYHLSYGSCYPDCPSSCASCSTPNRCSSCPPGYSLSNGSCEVTNCGAGNYLFNGTGCFSCPPGHYCPDGIEAVPCPSDRPSIGGGSSVSSCCPTYDVGTITGSCDCPPGMGTVTASCCYGSSCRCKCSGW